MVAKTEEEFGHFYGPNGSPPPYVPPRVSSAAGPAGPHHGAPPGPHGPPHKPPSSDCYCYCCVVQ